MELLIFIERNKVGEGRNGSLQFQIVVKEGVPEKVWHLSQDKGNKEVSHMDSCDKNIPGRRNKGPELVMSWPIAGAAKRSENYWGQRVKWVCGHIT